MRSGKPRHSLPIVKAIDWPGIHRRLEAVRVVIGQEWKPTPEQSSQTLKARARALAQERVDGAVASSDIELIEFSLAREIYGIGSAFVREVYPLTDLTPLPCTPPFVLGIVNIHGEIVSVIDIRRFFDLPELGLGDLNKVIVLQSEGMTFGILADLIVGVRTVPVAQIQPALPTMTGIREAYLMGVTADRMAVLDARKLLADKKIVVHETVEA